jgi:hypothetical protein
VPVLLLRNYFDAVVFRSSDSAGRVCGKEITTLSGAGGQCLYFQVKDGLAIGIKPLMDPQESEKYFDTDLLSRGVLAIFVSAENRESAKNFLLLKDRFTLQTAPKEELRVSGRDQVNSRGLNTVENIMAGAAILTLNTFAGLPFFPVAWGIHAHEERVKTKFVIEELQDKTISLGEKTQGFVYFRRPQGFPGPGQWILHIEVQDTNTQEVKVFDFTLNNN